MKTASQVYLENADKFSHVHSLGERRAIVSIIDEYAKQIQEEQIRICILNADVIPIDPDKSWQHDYCEYVTVDFEALRTCPRAIPLPDED